MRAKNTFLNNVMIVRVAKLWVIVFVFTGCLAFGNSSTPYHQKILKEIGSKGQQQGDSVWSVDLFAFFRWSVIIKEHDGTIKYFKLCRPDTINFKQGYVTHMSAKFKVDSALIDKINYLYFDLKGSALVKLNQQVLLRTGYFERSSLSTTILKEQDRYLAFLFNDTSATISIDYIPPVFTKKFISDLSICQEKYRVKNLKEEWAEEQIYLFDGSFHLAFGIIFFLIFIFFKSGKENFYFSLYALLLGSYYLLRKHEFTGFWDNFKFLFFLIAIECLAIFLSEIILNKRRNPVFLWITIVFVLVFSIFLNEVMESGMNSNSMITIFSVILFVAFQVISILYYIIQGFFQNRWEAKTITYGFLICFFSFIMIFVLAIIFSQTQNYSYISVIDYLPSIALLTILISMSIVLGRKNGENQAGLQKQLQEIKLLSMQNLERELEKKLILENQNLELEKNVEVRTKEVMMQKEIIEIKNREITENLLYAKKIQSALLPDVDLIKTHFSGFFVFYQPKDIVSGDFYSFISKDDDVFIAAADCTGHGVSGAFMSMIGFSLFNSLVNEKNIADPALILDKLNEEVVHSLKQQYSDSHDGMDMAVCRINQKHGFLEYAGANRPLWLIRDNVLLEYKADKFPIGGMQFSQNEKYTKHHIPVLKGDTIYLTSDGFADQFGGEKSKKLMTKMFKELLMKIQVLNMDEQQIHIEKYFNEWKGNQEQVDDVMVLGIRI